MKIFIFFLLVFPFPCLLFSAEPVTIRIREKDKAEYYSVAKSAVILEDKQHVLSFEEIKELSEEAGQNFQLLGEDNANLDFTSSTYWVKFKIRNEDAYPKKFLLEAARPLTNVADLYTVYENGLTIENKNGDEMKFAEREIQHRKLLFPVQFQANEELTFFMKLRSDGEVITLPIKLWHPEAMMQKDYHELYMFGFYYGILLFVIIIYFFFYIALREKSFLYYVIYVFCIALLQMSLDGLSFQYLWPGNTWWGNHIVVMSATLTAIFILLYARSFLKLRERMPGFNRMFNVFLVLCTCCFILAVSSGRLYSISFPLTNALSMLSAFLVVAAIFSALKKNYKVSWFFTFAFISLITGAIIFILSNFNLVPVTFFTEHALKYGSGIEIILLSLSMANKYREIQQEKEIAQAESLKIAQENEKLIREQNMVLEQKVKERTAEVVKQKEIIEEKNKDITDSINYAQGIQQAILPPDDKIRQYLPDSFILFRPRDIVSGDFYWMDVVEKADGSISSSADEKNEIRGDNFNKLTGKQADRLILFAVCDCTGHGVPGGFVSMVGHNGLSRAVKEQGLIRPAAILDRAAIMVEETFSKGNRKDGMDVVLCSLRQDHPAGNSEIEFAAANNPVYFARKKGNGKPAENGMELQPEAETDTHWLFQVDADKQPVGAYEYRKPFTNHRFSLLKGDTVYLSSDGFRDQFGGPKGKKFMAKNFKQLLVSIQGKSMQEQKNILSAAMEDWMKGYGQNDDICIIGVRI